MRFVFTDLTGWRFGRLQVVSLESREPSGSRWRCCCDCGGEKVIAVNALTCGRTRSCGCYKRERQSEANRRFKPTPGERFGRLTIVEEVQRASSGKRRFLCRCDCATEIVVFGFSLTSVTRPTKSCGCLQTEKAVEANVGNEYRLIHGDARNDNIAPEYKTWTGMIGRCENPNSTSFKYYGARGIKVCQRWRESYAAFLADMGKRPSCDYSIDRFPNNDGDYEPRNCRWATDKEQNQNRRPSTKWRRNA